MDGRATVNKGKGPSCSKRVASEIHGCVLPGLPCHGPEAAERESGVRLRWGSCEVGVLLLLGSQERQDMNDSRCMDDTCSMLETLW